MELFAYLAAFAIGVLMGTIAVGGVLLPPVLIYTFGLSAREAMATTLGTLIFVSVVATYLYRKMDAIDLRSALLLSLGSLIGGPLGVKLNLSMNEAQLLLLLSLFLLFSGAYILSQDRLMKSHHNWKQPSVATLFFLGLCIGVASGLTGIGGPLLSVPALIVLRFPVLLAIGTSQFSMFFAAASGTAGNIIADTINISLLFTITPLELAGVWIGARIVHKLRTGQLKKIVAFVYLTLGAGMLSNSSL